VLLLVSLGVGVLFAWVIQWASRGAMISGLQEFFALSTALSIWDLVLAMLLTVAVLMLGQAIISYEIFTGKSLPRRGLHKQWRNTLLFTAALSALSAGALTANIPEDYAVLALLLLVAITYALFNWQSYAEHERTLQRLRPFVASQRLFESILTPENTSEIDLAAPFSALCRDVLGVQQAALLPLGSLAALGITPLRYPAEPSAALADALLGALPGLPAQFSSPQMAGLPLDPASSGGMLWAAPLWSERGLIGLLLLGEKRDGGFYSLEEIEIARSAGERLADVLASAEMARRLVALQRQRLMESGILDRRTRRVLHDEILPRLHAALLQLGALPGAAPEAIEQLSSAHRQISDLLRDLPRAAPPELNRLGLTGALQRIPADELPGSFDKVTWQIDPQAEQRAGALPALAAEVIYYAAREAMRNAARHARSGSRPLELTVCVGWRNGLEIRIEDNGVGVPPKGASPAGGATSSGGGQGLALHSTLMAVINGSLALESVAGEGTRVVLWVGEGN
jgi:signal transduction histidine kinase